MQENEMLKLAFFKNNWRNHLWFPEPLVNLFSFFATTKRSAAKDGKTGCFVTNERSDYSSSDAAAEVVAVP